MIPFIDLKIQYKTIRKEINDAIASVLSSGEYVLGEELTLFETQFSSYCGTLHAIGVASGFDAILLSLQSLGIGKNDEVITSAHTFISTVLPILHLGAVPILVDADPETFLINPKMIQKYISNRTKVILPVHMYGNIADMDMINRIARKNHLFVVEDACQAHGSVYNGKRAGNLGDIGCFSFYPSKNLGAYGEGGAVTTGRAAIAKSVKTLRNVGQVRKNVHKVRGCNSRMDTLQAAILRVKLRHLDNWNKRRREIISIYQHQLTNLPLRFPLLHKKTVGNGHLFPVVTKHRNSLLEYLKKRGIYCGIHYPTPIHLHPCMKELGYKKGDFPFSERIARMTLSLPLYPELHDADLEYIITNVKKFFE